MSVRVFAVGPLHVGHTITLDEGESHYAVRVRRANAGARVEVLDGVGAVFDAVLVDADPRACRVELGDPHPSKTRAPLELGLGFPEPRATLEALTAACEVGATSVALIRCERSHTCAPAPERIDRVLRAAMRQSGRAMPPRVTGPIALATWLHADTDRPGFVATITERGHWTTPQPTGGRQGVRVLVGPEGGLTDAELEQARAAGLLAVGLGPWTLRTPTAVVAALARLANPDDT